MDDEKDDFEFEEDTLKRGVPTGDLEKAQQPPPKPPKESKQNTDD